MTTYFPFSRRSHMRGTFSAGLAVLTAFSLVPAIAIFVISFTDIRGIPGIPVNWVGAQNYVQFFSPAHLGDNLNALANTLIFAIASTTIQIVAALGLAVLLNRKLHGRSAYRAIVFMPTVLGVTVIGLIWTLVFNPSGGPATALLKWFHTNSAFFGDPKLALGLVIFVQIWSVLGISMMIFLAGLQAIPTELYEVADIDGASGWQRFRDVTFPLLAPSITANVLLGIVSSLQSYQLTYVLTGPQDPATQMLSLEVYVQGFGGTPVGASSVSLTQGYAATISVVQFVLVAAISLAVLLYLRKREARL
ncbi:MAG TPA: sugar ABC transporter permease [Galbitalea sp.]|nr:sugar ABC transporter permease [Galbitalea sp.]